MYKKIIMASLLSIGLITSANTLWNPPNPAAIARLSVDEIRDTIDRLRLDIREKTIRVDELRQMPWPDHIIEESVNSMDFLDEFEEAVELELLKDKIKFYQDLYEKRKSSE